MPIFWRQMLLIPLLALAIPVAALIGQRWRNGPLVGLSAGATLGVVIYLALTLAWLVGVPHNPYSDPYTESALVIFSLIGGAVLLLGAWALALTDALRERRRIWMALLCLLVYATFVGMLGFVTTPIISCGDALTPSGFPYCAPPDFHLFAIFAALSLAGPLALLIYALFAAFRRQPSPRQVSAILTADEGRGEQP